MPGPEAPSAPAAAPSPLSTAGVLGDQWPTQATDTIVDLVDKVATKTTGPIKKLGRAIVYGTFAAILGVTAFVLFTVLFVRLLNNYVVDGNIWAAYLIVGLTFVVVAAILASKATAPATDHA